MKTDDDLKTMTLAELRLEVMRLRTAFRKEARYTGNHRCWITLLETLPEEKNIQPLALPQKEFLTNCRRYYDRNQSKKISRN